LGSFGRALSVPEKRRKEGLMLSRNSCAIFVASVWTMTVFLGSISVAADEASPVADRLLKNLLVAVQNNDYDGFVSNGTAAFKAGLTPQMLAGVSAQLAARMNRGYGITYLGQLRQQGLGVYLWKLSFTDGSDDTLAKLVLDQDKVAGFWLQ